MQKSTNSKVIVMCVKTTNLLKIKNLFKAYNDTEKNHTITQAADNDQAIRNQATNDTNKYVCEETPQMLHKTLYHV